MNKISSSGGDSPLSLQQGKPCMQQLVLFAERERLSKVCADDNILVK